MTTPKRARTSSDDGFPRPFGRYVLLRQIGAGGMGEVYCALARHAMGVERFCALKTIRPELAQHTEFRARFREEARISVSMAHPNLIAVHEVGKVDETYFISMELVEGYDLGRVVMRARRHGRLFSLPAALYVVRELLAALDYSHRHTDAYGTPLSLVHRDVSPSNVLLSFDGRVRLADFGLALSAIRAVTTQSAKVWGKPGYVAPERLIGRPADRRVDIYAVGVLLYELLTGDPFVRSSDPALIVHEAKRRQRTPPSRIRREVPAEVDRIVRHAVAWNPAERFASAADFHDEVQVALVRLDPMFGARQLGAQTMARLFDPTSWRQPLIEALEEAKGVQQDERSIIHTFAGSSGGLSDELRASPTPTASASSGNRRYAKTPTELSVSLLNLLDVDDARQTLTPPPTLQADGGSDPAGDTGRYTPLTRPPSQVAGVLEVPDISGVHAVPANMRARAAAAMRRRSFTPTTPTTRPPARRAERDEHAANFDTAFDEQHTLLLPRDDDETQARIDIDKLDARARIDLGNPDVRARIDLDNPDTTQLDVAAPTNLDVERSDPDATLVHAQTSEPDATIVDAIYKIPEPTERTGAESTEAVDDDTVAETFDDETPFDVLLSDGPS